MLQCLKKNRFLFIGFYLSFVMFLGVLFGVYNSLDVYADDNTDYSIDVLATVRPDIEVRDLESFYKESLLAIQKVYKDNGDDIRNYDVICGRSNGTWTYPAVWSDDIQSMDVYVLEKGAYTINHSSDGSKLVINYSGKYSYYPVWANYYADGTSDIVVGSFVYRDTPIQTSIAINLGDVNGTSYMHLTTFPIRVNTHTLSPKFIVFDSLEDYDDDRYDGYLDVNGSVKPPSDGDSSEGNNITKPSLEDYPDTIGGYIQYIFDLLFYYISLPFKLIINFIKSIISVGSDFISQTDGVSSFIGSLFSSFPEWVVTPIKLVFSISCLMIVINLLLRR